MTEEEIHAQLMYEVTMHVARRMRDEGLITPEEYDKVNAVFLEKYDPLFGSLLSEAG